MEWRGVGGRYHVGVQEGMGWSAGGGGLVSEGQYPAMHT